MTPEQREYLHQETAELRAAVAAERERCAKIAEAIGDKHWARFKGRNPDFPQVDRRGVDLEQGASDAGSEIAVAIRSGNEALCNHIHAKHGPCVLAYGHEGEHRWEVQHGTTA